MFLSLISNAQTVLTNKSLFNEEEIIDTNIVAELYKFVNMINTKNYGLSDYYVYVVNVSLSNTGCKIYTFGYICNEEQYYDIAPEYIVIDSNNVIIVSFNSNLENKSIVGLELIKIDSGKMQIIKNKLLQKFDGYITGVFEGVVIKKCNNTIEKKMYENSDLIPKEQSIFRSLPFDNNVEIKEIIIR